MPTQYIKKSKCFYIVYLVFFCLKSFAQKDKDFLIRKEWAELYSQKGHFVQAIQNYNIAYSIDPSCSECIISIKNLKRKLEEKRKSNLLSRNTQNTKATLKKNIDSQNTKKNIEIKYSPILPEMSKLKYPYTNEDTTLNTYWMGKTEITQKEWKAFLLKTGKEFPKISENLINDNFPIINISWQDAKDYCQWLSDMTGDRYDLPTKEEWLIARGTITNIKNEAWIFENSQKNLHESGKKEKNSNGMFDIEGNVAEWVDDWYEKDFITTNNLKKYFEENETFKNRAVCGCSFKDESYFCKSPFIQSLDGMFTKENIGFRVVKRKY